MYVDDIASHVDGSRDIPHVVASIDEPLGEYIALSYQEPLPTLSGNDLGRRQSTTEIETLRRLNMKKAFLSMVAAFRSEANAKGRELQKTAKSVAISSEHEPSYHLREILLQDTSLLVNITLPLRGHIYERQSSAFSV
ncbi:hypothetical protein HG530_006290 [Fusarium avenaceum]|nr:hypothetical protein HG530_006290 [Fusarium avenaceum]